MTTTTLITAEKARQVMKLAKSLRATVERDVQGAAANGKNEAIFYLDSIDTNVLREFQEELKGRGFQTVANTQEDDSIVFVVNWEVTE